MKKFSNLKYIVFSFVLIIASFVFVKNASASYQYSYACSSQSGGGNIISYVDMVPGGPFSASSPAPFTVSASMYSTCTTRNVKLSAQNNLGAEHDIIPTQTLIQGGIVGPFFDSVNFNTNGLPAGTSYAVRFKTSVDEPNLCWQNNLNFVGSFRFGKITYSGPYINSQTPNDEFPVYVRLFGSGNPNRGIDPNEPGPIVGPFYINRKSGSHSYYHAASHNGGQDCGAPGGFAHECEIADPDGFDHGSITSPTCLEASNN